MLTAAVSETPLVSSSAAAGAWLRDVERALGGGTGEDSLFATVSGRLASFLHRESSSGGGVLLLGRSAPPRKVPVSGGGLSSVSALSATVYKGTGQNKSEGQRITTSLLQHMIHD